jgi:hypothetical protein
VIASAISAANDTLACERAGVPGVMVPKVR